MFGGGSTEVGPCHPTPPPPDDDDDDDDDDDEPVVLSAAEKQRAAACRELKAPQLVAGSGNARSLIGYARTFCMLRADHAVACWGGKSFGDVPTVVASPARAASLHVGAEHVCAIDRKGDLYCGKGLDDSKRVDTFNVPIRHWLQNDSFECALAKSGAVLCTDDPGPERGRYASRSDEPAKPIHGVSSAKSIVLGEHHGCALESNGTVKCWGYGDNNMGRKHNVLRFAEQSVRIPLDAPASP